MLSRCASSGSLRESGLRQASTMVSRRFIPSRLDGVENVQDYQPGGFHPISIGDAFEQGRFGVLHKLGFGGSSTVSLARDQQNRSLVTLKALRADMSSSSAVNQIPELVISQKLKATESKATNFQTVDHHFSVRGPNGTHFFFVTPFAEPSISAMYDCPGRTIGSRRLRADLARKAAKQTAEAVHHMHCAGIVHGDLTTSNILFRPSARMLAGSDAEVYAYLGEAETEAVGTCDRQLVGPHAPTMLVEPVQNSRLSDASLLEENIIVSDFGQAGFEADVWSLGCAIFEIRAGFPLFESFLGSDDGILKQTVEMLGRLPDPWWNAFGKRGLCFEEDGQHKNEEQKRAGT
ncbi:hypothetical protein D9619_005977 [Psilocybe cf. subviscida]|uniref:non-specific serine/threonine protein kinase n=1 Tax=Psilocybe cf. subviscida TaxID=2480587 RepID=A0A8H5BXR9_9AGAR|nr:hypothetical protein D9619_005977 [Psilocybe cf. subviscida]